MERLIENSIKIKGRLYYPNYHLVYTKDGKYIQIGESIKLSLGEDITADFSLLGTLSEQIADLSFLIDFFREGEATFGTTTIHRDPTKIENDIALRLTKFEAHLAYLTDIQHVFTSLNIKEELIINYNDFKAEYREKIDLLIGVILKGKRCSNKGLNDASPCLCGLQIFNIYVPVIFIKGQGNEPDKFLNILEQDTNVTISCSNGETYSISKYVLLEQMNYEEFPPQYYDRVLSSFQQDIIRHPILADRLNYSLLDMLHAYDKTANAELLGLCINFSKWLLENANELPFSIRKLNYLQSVKRQRSLTDSESDMLKDIIQNDAEPEQKIAAYLLSGNKEQAQVLFKALDNPELFKAFPIYKLFDA